MSQELCHDPPPPVQQQFYEKLQRPHVTARRAPRGSVRLCANAVVIPGLLHAAGVTAACCVCSAMDSSSAVEGHAFGQEQPPLYVTIQKILDKYPDGQIFKVCNMHGSIDP